MSTDLTEGFTESLAGFEDPEKPAQAAEAPDARPTMEEMAESLTGYEEIAIAKAFKIPDYTDLPPTMLGRAMVFALLRRREVADGDAYQQVMAMTLRNVRDQFAEDQEEVPEDPETESGKEGSAPA